MAHTHCPACGVAMEKDLGYHRCDGKFATEFCQDPKCKGYYPDELDPCTVCGKDFQWIVGVYNTIEEADIAIAQMANNNKEASNV
jgi:hypothetical protein